MRNESIPATADVVVIGGGPSGSLAAGLLSQNGFDVVLLDKVKHPRNTVGESLIPHFWRFAGQLKNAKKRLIEAQFVGKSGAMTLWGGKFRRTRFTDFGHKELPLHADRGEFDQILLNCGRDVGTRVFEEITVTKVDVDNPSRNVVHYTSPHDAVGGSITCKYIVDASGQSAVVAKQMGFRIFDESLRFTSLWGYYRGGSMMGFDGVIRPVSQRFTDPPVTFISTIGNWGWVWHIVLKDTVSVGVTLSPERLKAYVPPGGGKSIEDKYQGLVALTPGTRKLLGDAKFIEGSVNVIRDYAYKPVNLATPSVYLAGDAAAFVDPINSAGVSFGMYAGYLAAFCIGSSLRADHEREQYRQMYRTEYGRRLSIFRALAIPADRAPDDIDDLLRLLKSAVRMHSLPEQRLMLATSLLTNRPARIREVLEELKIQENSLFAEMQIASLEEDVALSSGLPSVTAA